MTECEIVQHSDQTLCRACGLAWDTNNPKPPKCIGQMQYRNKPVREMSRDELIIAMRQIADASNRKND